MQLSQIAWPVYSLGNSRPLEDGNVLYYFSLSKNAIGIVDDKDIQGDTLAKRRMELVRQGITPYKIKYALFFVADLIKIAKPSTWFIDSKGKLFQYKKSKSVPLVFRKITNTIKGVGYSLVEVHGHPARFMSLYPPTPEQKYAGLLVVDGAYILYGFFSEQHKSTHRKI